MEVQEKPRSAKLSWQLEHRAAALERFLERHQAWVLALWSVAYFISAALHARATPFWYDEILALLEARQPTLSAAMRALGDVDWMPPATHVVFYFTDKLLGAGEIAFRTPAMIGFWVFCLGLFFFARRRVSIYFALVALLLPLATSIEVFAYQARSYAPMLGLSAIAMVCWQTSTETTRRAWPLVGLAACIGGAISLQYWGVLIYLPLAGAEAYRDFKRRRIDWPIWIAFAAGAVPLAASLFLILHGVQAWHPWREAKFTDYFGAYRAIFLGWSWPRFAVPAALALGAWFVLGGSKQEPQGSSPCAVPDRDWVAAALLLAIPAGVISIALAIPPHMFTERYGILFIAGFSLLISFLAALIAGRRAALGLAFALAALVPFGHWLREHGPRQNPFAQSALLQQALEHDPVVVDTVLGSYLQLWYYAPDELKPHLLFLWHEPKTRIAVNGPFATEFPKVGVPVIDYESFAVPGREFLIYSNRIRALQRRIRAHGGTLVVESFDGKNSLVRARIAGQEH